MITEDYVSFETAKLLKEKGFDEPCLMCYTYDKKLGNYGQYNSYKNSEVFSLTAPTIQMAMKWLREVHNLSVEPYYTHKQEYKFAIQEIPTAISLWMDLPKELYSTYEAACEAAIKHCLEKLI